MNPPVDPLLLGKIALQKGLLTRPQLDESIALQETTTPPRPLGEILMEQGYITPTQLEELLLAQQVTMKAPHPAHGSVKKQDGKWEAVRREDMLFGKLAVEQGLAEKARVDETLRIQEQMHHRGVTVRLGEVMVKKGYLSPEQVKTILAAQAKTILSCPKCGKNYNVKNYRAGKEVFCPQCSAALVLPGYERTIDAHGSAVLPAVSETPQQEKYSGEEFGPLIVSASGKRIARYRLQELLGQGGMGKVYKAWDCHLKRVVALKQIIPGEASDATAVERFLREARAAAKLEHPNIVQVYDIGEHGGKHYFTMRYVEGLPLNKPGQKITVRRAGEIIRDVARALHYAHQQGVIHRDVKPHNVILDAHGTPLVADFGLAKDVSSIGERNVSHSGLLLGTPAYWSPEHTEGNPKSIGPAADQFSLGVVMYELIAGKPPFSARTRQALMREICDKEPPTPTALRRTIPQDVETICLKALEKDPAKRYASLEEMANDLDRWLSDEPILARPISTAARLSRRAMKRKAVVLPSAAAALLAIAFGAWVLAGSLQEARDIEAALARAQAAEAAASNPAAPSSPPKRPQGAKEGVTRGGPADEALERELTAARDAFNEALTFDRGNAQAKAGLDRTQKRLDELKAAREMRLADASRQAASAEADRKAQSEAGELLELGRKGIDAAWHYLYNKDANYEELVKKVALGQEKIEEAIARAPNMALAHYLLGRCWNLRGYDDRAEICWRKSIELNPQFGPSHYELGRLLMTRSFLLNLSYDQEQRVTNRPEVRRLAEEAGRELEKAEKGLGLDSALQRAVADVMKRYAAGEPESVRRLAQEGIKKFKGQTGVEDFHFFVGSVSPSGSTEGTADLDRAIELCPGHVLALFCRGTMRQAKGDLDGAIEDYTAALKINSRLAPAFYNRGASRADRGDFDGATEDYAEATKINPRDAEPFFASGNARYTKGDLDGAIRDWTEALKINPRHAEALRNRGIAREAEGDLDGAIHDYTEALKINPRFAEAFNDRGNARKAKGDLDGAIQEYTEALKINPRFSHALNNRGQARHLKGDHDGAIQDCTGALEISPQYVEAFVNRGNARKAKRDLDGAIQDYTESLKFNPRYAGAFCCRSLARIAKRDFDGAIQDCNEALKIDPRFAEAFANRGYARHAKGDFVDAIEDCTKALEVAPPDWPYRKQVEDLLAKTREKRGAK